MQVGQLSRTTDLEEYGVKGMLQKAGLLPDIQPSGPNLEGLRAGPHSLLGPLRDPQLQENHAANSALFRGILEHPRALNPKPSNTKRALFAATIQYTVERKPRC